MNALLGVKECELSQSHVLGIGLCNNELWRAGAELCQAQAKHRIVYLWPDLAHFDSLMQFDFANFVHNSNFVTFEVYFEHLVWYI